MAAYMAQLENEMETNEVESTDSVFDLITKLSKEIVAEHIKDPVLPATKKHLYKKLRSTAFGILLKKYPVPEDERKKIPYDEFEFINHPPSELLLIATPDAGKEQTFRQIKLQECMDHLISSGASEKPMVQNAMELFLYLVDELPKDQVPVKPNKFGFINTDYYWALINSKKKNKDGIKPYAWHGSELFDSEPLRRWLKEGSGASFQYQPLRPDAFDHKRDFGESLSLMIQKRTNSTSSQFVSTAHVDPSTSTTIRCHRSCMPPDQRPVSELLGPILTGEWWDEELYKTSARRTWEHLGNTNPPEYKIFLMDFLPDGSSMVHDLLRIKQENINVIDTATFIRHLKFLLIGISSDTFILQEDNKTFCLASDSCTYGLSPDAVLATCADSIACGAMARRLSEASPIQPPERGQMYGNLCESLRRFLRYHHVAVMDQPENATVFEIAWKIAPQLKYLLTCMNRLCDVITDKPGLGGSQLLTNVYDHAMRNVAPLHSHLFLSVLSSAVTQYLRLLESWLFKGECDAPSGEFFIERQPDYASLRDRMYWKKAFTFTDRKQDAPGFLKGLESAILETGRSVDLLRMCNPRHPLLPVMSGPARPKLTFVTRASELKPVEAAFESYYRTAAAAAGPPVSVGQLFEKSLEAEHALQARVQHVFERRVAEHASAQRDAAAERAAVKAEQMAAWHLQMRLRSEQRDRAAAHERKIDEEIAQHEALARQRDAETREAMRQELVDQYKTAMESVESKRQRLHDELAVESRTAVTESLPAATEPSPSEASVSTTPSDFSDTKQSPVYEGLPSPHANTDVITSLYRDRDIVDNNRLNLAEDEQNQNAACDNLIVESSPPTTQRKAELTLDLQRTATDNRNRVLGASAALTKPWATPENEVPRSKNTELSPEEYSRLATLGSRKASAERIREKMCGISRPPWNLADGNANETDVPTVTRKSSLTLDLQRLAAANRNKVMSADDALTKPWDERPSDEMSTEEYNLLAALGSRKSSAERIKQRISGVLPYQKVPTAEEIKRKVLITEFGIEDSARTESSRSENEPETAVINSSSTSVSLRVDGVPMEQMDVSPAENAGVKVEYVRELSNVSSAYDCTTPGLAMVDSDADILSVPSVPTRYSRAYSYGPCAGYDHEWKQRLADSQKRAASLLTPCRDSVEPKIVDEQDGDLGTVNHTLKRMLIIPVRTQMTLVNDAILKHFLVDADLLTHLQSLRNYYFLLDGEFGRAVTSLLFQRLEAGTEPEDLVCPGNLGNILDQALAATIDGDNVNARRLTICADNAPERFRLSDPNALNCILLRYSVEWPLNIIITSTVIDKYQEIFSFLLKLRRSSWVMNELFGTMKRQAADRTMLKSPQFCKTQFIRHVMTHMMCGLHNYVTSTVLNESWCDLQHALKQCATLEDIYQSHVTYVKVVMSRCLLGVKGYSEQFQSYLNNILILVLKFHGHLTYGGGWSKDPKSGHYTHSRYREILKVYQLYQMQTASLVKVCSKLAKGEHSHLFEFMQKLSMNDFYELKA